MGREAKVASQNILNNRWCQIIGSDAHNNQNRNFCMKDALNYIDSIVDFDLNHLFINNPQKIINGEPISFDIDYQNYRKSLGAVKKMKNFLIRKVLK